MRKRILSTLLIASGWLLFPSISSCQPPSPAGQRLDKEAALLLAKLRETAVDPGPDFYRAANDLMFDYEQDPRLLMKELTGLLKSQNPVVRYRIAHLFFRCGFESESAKRTLLAIASADAKIPVKLDDEDLEDLRIPTTLFLARYRVLEASDPLWKFYTETEGRIFADELINLRDTRYGDLISKKISTTGRASNHARAIGEFGLKQFQEPLLRVSEVLKSRDISPSDDSRLNDIHWALYTLTGEAGHLQKLIDPSNSLHAAYYLCTMKEPEVRPILLAWLRGYNAGSHARQAMLGLFHMNPQDPDLRDYFIRFFKGEFRDQKVGVDVLYRVASKMNDPEIDRLAEEYDRKWGVTRWTFYEKHRAEWPLDDLMQNSIRY